MIKGGEGGGLDSIVHSAEPVLLLGEVSPAHQAVPVCVIIYLEAALVEFNLYRSHLHLCIISDELLPVTVIRDGVGV